MSDSLDIENGILSFANPNYHLAPSDVNSNTESITDTELPDEEYDELYEELDSVCRFNRKAAIQSRRSYAQLDTVSMGVDLDADLSLALENKHFPDCENNIGNKEDVEATTSRELKQTTNSETNNNANLNSNDIKNPECSMGRRSGFLEYYLNLEAAVRQRKETLPLIKNDQSNSTAKQHSRSATPERENTGPIKLSSVGVDVPHMYGDVTNDLYALPIKKNQHIPLDQKRDDHNPAVPLCSIPISEIKTCNDKQFYIKEQRTDDDLPSGWEKHEDDCGPYYWHISSGTIQREPPAPPLPNHKYHSKHFSRDLDMISSISDFSLPSSKSSSSPSVGSEMHHNISIAQNIEIQFKRRSFTEGTCSLTPDKKPIRFAVRSLGWVEIAEDDLTPERSSKAVNKCIVDLSLGRNDILDVVGRWGDPCGMWQGKDLFMDLDDYCLRLTDPQDLTILNTQPIHTIRVWGVGRDNGRDFAYVARDKVTRKHMCHVFRCDIPARIIANTLRDICKKIMIERSLHHSLAKPVGAGSQGLNSRNVPARPTNLPTEQRRFYHEGVSQGSYLAQSFPTPMEEPKKVLKVHYLGTIQVVRPVGMEILNSAIDTLVAALPPSQYKFVNVAVAPSTITISEPGEDGKQLAECRVRFLSFLGIGRNVKHCAFIMHTAQDQFIGHVFYCEPSSGALCKTIEAACKLRYQKCLDAHHQVLEKKNSEEHENKEEG